LAVEEFHGDESFTSVFADVVDGANVWVIESGRGSGFAAETLESLRVVGDVVGEKFESDEAIEAVSSAL
jgi:hypothetical protein